MEPISLKPKKSDRDDMAVPMSYHDDSCPQVYLSGGKDLADLPKAGTITFSFRRKEISIRDGDDKPVRMTLELESIEDAVEDSSRAEEESDEVADDSADAGEALDRQFKKAVRQTDEEIED